MKRDPNFALTEGVARQLGPLLPEFVFVGGCATGLLITDTGSAPVRITRDVDVIVKLSSYQEYMQLTGRLKGLGFKEDNSEGAPLCRWVIDDMRLDVMPTASAILGFANRWYADAIQASRELELAPGLKIRLVTSPFFLATKLEAFLTRGQGDVYTSHDLEDVIAVIDGRSELVEEIEASSHEVKRYLVDQFSALLANNEFAFSLPGHFLPDDISQGRVGFVLSRLRAMISAR